MSEESTARQLKAWRRGKSLFFSVDLSLRAQKGDRQDAGWGGEKINCFKI